MTTDRHDTVHRTDGDADSGATGLQNEFWGGRAEWTPTAPRRSARQRIGIGATASRRWASLLGAGASTAHERTHHPVDTAPDQHAPIRQSSLDRQDDSVLHEDAGVWDVQPEPQPIRRPGVDPLLARFGGLAVILTLAVPVVLGFTSGSDRDSAAIGPAAAAAMLTAPSDDAAVSQPPTTVPVTTTPPLAPTSAATASASDASAPATTPTTAAILASDVTDTVTQTTAAPCGGRYELAQGDYWIRIAEAAGVSLGSLLEANDATTETVLVPGRSICLPAGASVPAPPPPPTSASPSTTTGGASRPVVTNRPAAATPPTTSPPTTAAPAPTTTVSPRPAAVSAAEAEAIIRSVWPDDLEERALQIAWRESNYRSNVNNSCCYGLFQIHWSAHRSWLGSMGITTAAQLWDARLNTEAAYALYRRSGGFGPWGG